MMEIITGGGFSFTIDVWSLGIMLMCEGETPYLDHPLIKVQIFTLPLFPSLPSLLSLQTIGKVLLGKVYHVVLLIPPFHPQMEPVFLIKAGTPFKTKPTLLHSVSPRWLDHFVLTKLYQGLLMMSTEEFHD
eukprot:TRINITY_DN9064_c0_g2_i2.p3 TRINITY_DN9064_c0_g2~~TRINITY_DN9064_c0_g2_i2.p3  ORF type:complete len:131 (+),score=20.83 TRINITY_DN9064_c0_g2_i2:303-695(+)